MSLNACDSSSNSSPVLMSPRVFRSPADALAATSRSTRTGERISRIVMNQNAAIAVSPANRPAATI